MVPSVVRTLAWTSCQSSFVLIQERSRSHRLRLSWRGSHRCTNRSVRL